MFTALVDWVEKGTAPGSIVISSRDSAVNYPICAYPQKVKYSGTGPVNAASSFGCIGP